MLIVFAVLYTTACSQDSLIEIRRIGLLSDDYFYLPDGGAGNISILFDRIIVKNKSIRIKGKMIDLLSGNPISFYRVLVGTNLLKEKKLIIKDTVFDSNFINGVEDGIIDIFIKLNDNENIYIDAVGFNILEIKKKHIGKYNVKYRKEKNNKPKQNKNKQKFEIQKN